MLAQDVRAVCMSLPDTTETVQWGCDLVFKVGGKMYAVTPLELRACACRSSARLKISPS